MRTRDCRARSVAGATLTLGRVLIELGAQSSRYDRILVDVTNSLRHLLYHVHKLVACYRSADRVRYVARRHPFALNELAHRRIGVQQFDSLL